MKFKNTLDCNLRKASEEVDFNSRFDLIQPIDYCDRVTWHYTVTISTIVTQLCQKSELQVWECPNFNPNCINWTSREKQCSMYDGKCYSCNSFVCKSKFIHVCRMLTWREIWNINASINQNHFYKCVRIESYL